jgi:phage I-like protein
MNKPLTFTAGAMVLPLSGEALPSRIELIPVGDLRLGDERGLVGQITNPAALIQRTMAAAKGGVLPVDFAHGMDGQGTGDTRAAGWITALDVEGDRIMATVEWTPVGTEALQGRIYRFISPTFTVPEEGGEAGLILRAGLTNNPAFRELAKVASLQENPKMPQWLTQLAAKLGMPEETDETKIMAAAESAINQAGNAAPIITAAGLTGVLTETAATAITAKITASSESGEPDPAKYVPIAAVSELTGQLASLRAEVSGDKADTIVTAAVKEGKVTPALEPWARKYAASDLEGFKTWLAGAPVVVDGTTVTPPGDASLSAGKLTAEERQVITATGISEEAFLATKQGKAPAKKKEA